MHTFRSVRANIESSAFAGDAHARSTVLTVLPTFHVAGLHLFGATDAWAHGQDIRDALGRPPAVSHRLRNIAHLAVTAEGPDAETWPDIIQAYAGPSAGELASMANATSTMPCRMAARIMSWTNRAPELPSQFLR